MPRAVTSSATLNDFLPPFRIYVDCRGCGHQAYLNIPALIARFGAETPIERIVARLRCSVCQGKAVETRQAYTVLSPLVKRTPETP